MPELTPEQLARQQIDVQLVACGWVVQTIEAIPIPLPPLAEQERIVAEVERRLSVVEELSALVETTLKRANRLRQAVLQQAFTGRLVPSLA